MSKSTDKLQADANRLRDQLAKAEAAVCELRAKLAKVEAKLNGEPAPESGLDLLWNEAPPMARTRSSKRECRVEWQRIHPSERPTTKILLEAMRAWMRCREWRKDGNDFVPGLHRWIKNRQWENLPADAQPAPSRYRQPEPPKPQPTEAPALPEEIAAILAPLTRRVRS